MSPQAWTREQDLAVLYLKVEYHGELAPGHTAVLALAGAMKPDRGVHLDAEGQFRRFGYCRTWGRSQ